MMCGGMMLLLIPGAISNSNAVIRQEFRKLRFQMIDDILSAGHLECSKQRSPGATPHVGQGTENNCFAVRSLNLIWIPILKSPHKPSVKAD
ncbi:MAG: hypothetical protein DMG41_35685 [Acidobacteria bacterium]|nr:MAG: hypothetical protein AUH13_07865 [Acidobacteria bacterium 13_2_20CM_58_27]PYT69216.1 MAG: hypothetical protein DMG42_22330 [Acidobacteriota bacterium]PYT81134.1 MAG: hypothetical protein DMG41_35685 [Acidobacteriota bacterium]